MYQWKYSAQDLSHSLKIYFLASLIDYYEEDEKCFYLLNLGYLYFWPNHFTFKLGFMIWMYADYIKPETTAETLRIRKLNPLKVCEL